MYEAGAAAARSIPPVNGFGEISWAKKDQDQKHQESDLIHPGGTGSRLFLTTQFRRQSNMYRLSNAARIWRRSSSFALAVRKKSKPGRHGLAMPSPAAPVVALKVTGMETGKINRQDHKDGTIDFGVPRYIYTSGEDRWAPAQGKSSPRVAYQDGKACEADDAGHRSP